ncbi:MAG TPA: hypothetical protein VLL27_14820 [Solirubrobacterales bacterium]|nr:hypothetical protein [Solirubrobacterales bacterium]
MGELPFNPGDVTKRVELHEQFGGRRQGGISPSKQSSNVFLFTDQARGALHGYIYDGQGEDGYYHYTGEGQYGDQRMVQGNRSIRDHAKEERDLHLFDVNGGLATYLGRFEYVDHYSADAPETGEGRERKVIVFRLRRLTGAVPLAHARIGQFGGERVKVIPVEQHLTERMVIEPNREPYEAERREQPLVLSFANALRARGHDVNRLQLRPDGEAAPILCDLFDATTKTLIEAKGSVSRNSIRMAIGQLADYARLVDTRPTKAILVPEKPRHDLLHLAASQDIEVIWPNESGGFEASKPE